MVAGAPGYERDPIGRTREMYELRRALASVAEGDKRSLVLLGPPGMGKTTLLRWIRSQASKAGFLTTFVRSPAAAGLPARFPIGELLGGLNDSCLASGLRAPTELSRILETLRGTPSANSYPAALPHIAHALEAMGEVAHLALFLDDYQWAPAEATELLLAALRVIEVPALFVAAARGLDLEEKASSVLPQATADLPVDFLRLDPLAESAVHELASEYLGGSVLPSLTRRLTEISYGNPLVVTEALRRWNDRRCVQRIGNHWGLSEENEDLASTSLVDLLSARVAALTDRQLLAASIFVLLGRDASFDECRDISGEPYDELIELLRRLVVDGILVEEGHLAPIYRVAHPLIESAIVTRVGSTRTAAIHGQIFSALIERTGTGVHVSAAELAHHAVRALEPSSRIDQLALSAAQEAEAAGSFEEAATWYGYLVTRKSNDVGALVSSIAGQARATTNFDPIGAADLFTSALLLCDGESQARSIPLLLGRAYAYRLSGQFDRAINDLSHARSKAIDEQERFQIIHMMSVLEALQGRFDAAEQLLIVLASEGHGLDHPKIRGHLGSFAFSRSDILTARKSWKAALAVCNEPEYGTFLRHNLAWVTTILGEWAEAERLLRRAIGDAASAGDLWNLVALLATAGRLYAWKGEPANSLDHAWRAVRLAPKLQNPACRIDSLDALGVALLEDGQHDQAVEALSTATRLVSPQVEMRELSFTFAVLAEAQVHLANPSVAREACQAARGFLGDALFWAVMVDRVESEILIREGRAAAALDLLQPWLVEPPLLPYEEARVNETASRVLKSLKRREEAIAVAQRAESIFSQLGAQTRLNSLSALLEELHTGRRGRPRSKNPKGLTDRELQVMRLLIQGKTATEVGTALTISTLTARKHAEHLMAKLGVSRRAELVAAARQLGFTDEESQSTG